MGSSLFVLLVATLAGPVFCTGIAGSPQATPPPDNVDYNAIRRTLPCRMSESIRSWMEIAERTNRTLERMGSSFADVKPYFRTVYDQMKGTADILSALPNVTALSREAQYQADHYCQNAPIGIRNFVQILKAKSPAFSEKFGADLKVLEDSATLMADKLRAC